MLRRKDHLWLPSQNPSSPYLMMQCGRIPDGVALASLGEAEGWYVDDVRIDVISVGTTLEFGPGEPVAIAQSAVNIGAINQAAACAECEPATVTWELRDCDGNAKSRVDRAISGEFCAEIWDPYAARKTGPAMRSIAAGIIPQSAIRIPQSIHAKASRIKSPTSLVV